VSSLSIIEMKEKADKGRKWRRNKDIFGFFHTEQKHKHLNTQFSNIGMMKDKKGKKGRMRPRGVSARGGPNDGE